MVDYYDSLKCKRISPSAVYDRLWECRDLEIKMLWTRLTLLGAFMALTYTGYGVLVLKGLDKLVEWNVFNLLAIGVCGFGGVFSVLWTMTAKGSKTWFEVYEAAIVYFQETYKDLGLFSKVQDEELVLSYLDYNKPFIRRRRQAIDNWLFSTKAGTYSVSRIPTAMGQCSLLIWIVLTVVHFIFLAAGRDYAMEIVNRLCMPLAALMVLTIVVSIWLVVENCKSGNCE